MTTLLAGVASFLFIFLKSFQQRNVAFDRYWFVAPTTMAMVYAEFYVIVQVAKRGYDFAFITMLGVASAGGCLLAMVLHKKLFNYLDKKENNNE